MNNPKIEIPIMITTKAEAILDLIKLQQDFTNKGAQLHNIDTYSFEAHQHNQKVKVSWDGFYIVSEIIIN